MSTNILIKHHHVYIYYLLYLKANSNEIIKMPKKRIYIEVARPFFIERQACAKIINKMLKNGYKPSRFEVEEFKFKFKDMPLIQGIEIN